MRSFAALIAISGSSLLATNSASHAQSAAATTSLTARAELLDAHGKRLGVVTLQETPFYGVLVRAEASGLTPGPHAMHLHETGKCEPPSFQSAGGHYAPRGHAHGALAPRGKHAGDLLNVHVPENGKLEVEQLAEHVTLREGAANTLMDADGSAVVLHAGADDYRSQPSGGAGKEVACGVIRR